jgi:integrase
MANLKGMKKHRGAKLPLTQKEYLKIRNLIQKEKKRYWTRNLLLICMQANTSLRSCDLLKLKVGDIMMNGRFLSNIMQIQKKTDKPIYLEIVDSIKNDLHNAKTEYESRLARNYFSNGSNPLFPSFRRDEKGCFKPLSYGMYFRLIKTWVDEIQLNPDLYGTHSLRTSIPILVYERESDGIQKAKAMLGHRKSKTTEIYVQSIESYLARKYRRKYQW